MNEQNNIHQVNASMKRNGKDLKLKYPFSFDDRQITSVFVRRMKGRDMRLLPATGENSEVSVEDMFPLCCALIEEPDDFIDEMDGEDIEALMEIVTGFMDSSDKKKKQASRKRGQR